MAIIYFVLVHPTPPASELLILSLVPSPPLNCPPSAFMSNTLQYPLSAAPLKSPFPYTYMHTQTNSNLGSTCEKTCSDRPSLAYFAYCSDFHNFEEAVMSPMYALTHLLGE